MYSAVPPPDNNSSVINKDGEIEKEGPPRGISQETWEVVSFNCRFLLKTFSRVFSLILSVWLKLRNLSTVEYLHVIGNGHFSLADLLFLHNCREH